MPIEFIDEVKNTIESNLPASSGIIGEVIKTIYDQSSSAADLTDIIERDPSLSAEIIKISNSAFYSSISSIDSIKRAIVVLGFDTIKEIVTTVTTLKYFFSSEDSFAIDRSGLWLHSVGTAKASQLISKKLNYEKSEVTYTVGLLHDIGRILLALYFPEKYIQIIQLASEKKCRIILAEQKVLKTNHCILGKMLCELWGLPENITSAIFFHHEPLLAPKDSQFNARFVNLGDYMCRKAGIGNPGDDLIIEPSSAILHTLGSKPDKIQNMFDEIFQELLELKDDIEGFYSGMK